MMSSARENALWTQLQKYKNIMDLNNFEGCDWICLHQGDSNPFVSLLKVTILRKNIFLTKTEQNVQVNKKVLFKI